MSHIQPGGEPGSSFRIVFHHGATELELRRLLRSLEAEIVGGPSAVGAYTLRVSGETVDDDVLARLRTAAVVRLAEPVGSR